MKSDYMKQENYAKLFAFMTYENALACRVTLETGLRIGDVLKLEVGDLRGRTLSFTAEKTGKRGKVTISQDLANRLRAIAGVRFFFPKRGNQNDHRTRQTVWRDVKRAAGALRAAGLVGSENITPHSARKTFAVVDAEHYGLLHTQKVLQHKHKETTKLYAFSDKYLGTFSTEFLIKALADEVRGLSEKMERIMVILADNDSATNQKVTNHNRESPRP